MKIPVLRIRDENGNDVEIPAIRGPQGPPGTPGKDGKDAPSLYEIGQMIYPVGSVYISVAATDPADIFGGVWQQLKDRFLLAAGDTYAAGSEGGEATHKLTVEEMPIHRHELCPMIKNPSSDDTESTGEAYKVILTQDNLVGPGQEVRKSTVYGGHTSSNGGDNSHNNMPPYLAVYMWQRIS